MPPAPIPLPSACMHTHATATMLLVSCTNFRPCFKVICHSLPHSLSSHQLWAIEQPGEWKSFSNERNIEGILYM